MIIYFIRHGQIDEDVIPDPSLNEVGKENSSKIIVQNVECVFSSPLKRCVDTYERITSFANLPLEILDLCREQKCDLTDFTERESKFPLVFENEEDILKRCELLREYLKKLHYSSVAIVSHANFIWYFTKMIGEEIWIENCDVLKVSI